MERPQTIYGLKDKRKQLVMFLDRLAGERMAAMEALGHVEACIDLFERKAQAFDVFRYTPEHRSRRGTLSRFVNETIRTATAPVTMPQVAAKWLAHIGAEPVTAVKKAAKKQVQVRFFLLKQRGEIEEVRIPGPAKGWRLTKA